MPFDLNTAMLEENKGFDLNTATEDRPAGDKGWEIKAYEPPTLMDRIRTSVDWVKKTPFVGFAEGYKDVNVGKLNTKEMIRGLTSDESKNLQRLENRKPVDFGIKKKEYVNENPDNFFERVGEGISNFAKTGYSEAFRMLPMTIESIKSGGIGGGIGGILGLGVGAIATRKPQGAVEGLKIGARLGGGLGVAKKTFELEAGFARSEMKEIVDNEGNPLDENMVNIAASSVGVVNAALEAYGLSAILKTIPGGDKILGAFSAKGVAEVLKNETVQAQLKEIAKKYAGAVATETQTEMLQEGSVVIASEILKKMNGVDNGPLEQHIARIMDVGIATAAATMFMVAPTSAASVAGVYAKRGMDIKSAQAKADAMTSDEIVEFLNENSDEVVDIGVDDLTVGKAQRVFDSVSKGHKAKLVESGLDEKKADLATNVFMTQLEQLSKKTGIPIDELYESEAPEIVQDKAELAGGVVYNQDAVEVAGATQDETADAVRQWQEKGTDSPYFRKWFGKSKVVDKDGKPKIMYHGSKEKFDVFGDYSQRGRINAERDKPLKIRGHYFSDNKEVADVYANLGKDKGIIREFYLAMENPKIYKKYTDISTITEEKVKELKKQGYDGAIYLDEGELNTGGIMNEYVVFDSEQIKSVDNQGTFDANNPNIYYQKDSKSKKEVAENFDHLLKATGYKENVYFKTEISNTNNEIEKQITDEIEAVLKASPKDKILRRNIRLGSASARIKEVNSKVKDIRISPNYARILNENGSEAILNQLSSLLQNPIAVLKPIANNSNGISLVVEYDKSANAKGIAKIDLELKKAGIKDKAVHYYSVKKIKANYRKADFNNLFREMLTQNKLLKIDNSKTYILEQYMNKLSIPEKRENPLKKEFIKGAFIKDKNIIELFRTADESTIIHEFAHWWLSVIEKYAENTEEMMLDMIEIRKFLGNNGEEFTEKQHEKFARGFEAYIRSGSGRTNRLKKIFEDFKNFLLDIYQSITELGFKDDEIPQIEALFERLLTTENERVKKNVFDKIDDLSDKIRQVKDNQEKEYEELENIYTENKERIERNNQIKKMTQEFLDKASRAASKENPEVKAYKERYKKVTLDILEIATGYKRQFIANSKNWEIIQEKIGNIDDPFSSGDGFLSEWNEFYSDTGVSYDNQEVGGDYDLASQAFDVLTNGTYEIGDFRYADIDQFFGKYEYLINKVKTSKGNQRVAALEAAVSLFSEMPSMPDEAAQDVLRMYSEIDNQFDNLDEEKKEEFEKRRYPDLPTATQIGLFLSRKIGELRIYDKEIGYKRAINKSDSLYALIKNTDSVFKAKEALRKINGYIIQDIENKQKLLLHKEIQKQIKVSSRLIKTSGIKKGKFDWQTNTIFQELKELNRLKKNDALKEYIELIQASPENIAAGEVRENFKDTQLSMREFKNDFGENLKRKFMEYRANDVQHGNVSLMRSVLEDLMALKFEGIRAKSEAELAKKLEKQSYENNLIEILEENDNFTKFGAKWIEETKTLANWESLLNAIFDKETAEKYSLLFEESSAEVYARQKVTKLYDAVRRIYNLKKADDDKGFIKMTKGVMLKAIDYDQAQQIIDLFKSFEDEKYNYTSYTFDANSRGKFIETQAELSKANIMMYYGWSLNSQLKQRLMTEFCPMEDAENQEKFLDEMFSILTEQDKEAMFAMIDLCDEIYQDTNEIYIRQFGLSLPYTENYLPSKAERIMSEVDMLHENIVRSSNPNFIKQRANCKFIQMAKITPMEVILPHINKSSNYVAVSERVTFLNKLFKTNILKNKMIEVYGQKDGKELYYTLLNQLSASTYTTNAQGLSLAKDLVNNVSSSIIPASIGGSAKVMFGQLLSVVNYAENMPPGEWAKGFAKALVKPKETVKYMLENVPYLEARIASNSQNEVIASITNEADKYRSIKNFFTMNTRWGDVYAIALGGKPFYDFLLAKARKEGQTEEQAKAMAAEALKQFIIHTLRTQQAGVPSSTSQWQKDQSRHFLTRIFFAFRNTEIQFERKVVDANLQLKRGDISAKQWFKTVFIYKIMNPIMFTSFLTNLGLLRLSRALFLGDDPEDELLSLLGDGALAILLSTCNAYGMAGMLVGAVTQWAFAKLGNKGKYFESAVPVLSDFEQSIGKLFTKKELTFEDWIDAAAFTGEARAGIPARKLINFAGGFGDMVQGEPGIGLTRMFGIGRYAATEAWTGKAPKKSKKTSGLNFK